MPVVSLYGHEELRSRLGAAARGGTLPASLLLHGPRGIGKQRLALWLAQLLLCEKDSAPCGKCSHCRYAVELTHPDIHWYFPRPRPAGGEPDLDDVREDIREATAERAASGGLYATPPGNEGIFVATVKAIIRDVALTPALARRKVIIVGDAERMTPQEGSEFAANAFLKLLEEPPANTTIILTSSEPGALLPTIRSRTVAVRVAPLAEADVRAFLADPAVAAALDEAGAPETAAERVREAAGAPGVLFGDEARRKAMATARKLLDAATAPSPSARHAAALTVGASGARGSFTDTLDAILVLLGERMRAALHDGNEHRALAASRAAEKVTTARLRAAGNVNPQLLMSALLRDLRSALA